MCHAARQQPERPHTSHSLGPKLRGYPWARADQFSHSHSAKQQQQHTVIFTLRGKEKLCSRSGNLNPYTLSSCSTDSGTASPFSCLVLLVSPSLLTTTVLLHASEFMTYGLLSSNSDWYGGRQMIDRIMTFPIGTNRKVKSLREKGASARVYLTPIHWQ